MSIHMRIVQDGSLIADLPDWDGPVPRKGEYIFHPPLGDQDVIPGPATGIAGCVAIVCWRLYDRSGDPGATVFTQTARPYVEITL